MRKLNFSFTLLLSGVLVCFAVNVPCFAQNSFDFDFGDNHYRIITTGRSWVEASSDATATIFNGVSGALARIDSAEENQAIFTQAIANIDSSDFSNTVANDGGGGAYLWLGGSDRVTEGQWIWDGDNDGSGDLFWQGDENGSSAGGLFTNFGTTSGTQNEPDDFNSNQDALGLSLDGWPLGTASQWNDVAETNTLFYVIEFEQAAIPEPSCFLVLVGMGLTWFVKQRRKN